MKKRAIQDLRTWVEIDARAAKANYTVFRKLIEEKGSGNRKGKKRGNKKVKLWAVVKSNAYGHGLFAFSEVMDRCGVDGFCVDSLVEGVALRRIGIKKPILVLGSTLPVRYAEAARHSITISIASFDALRALARMAGAPSRSGKKIPEFHLKIDTGMHRQGFYVEDVPRVIRFLKVGTPAIQRAMRSHLKSVFTHFAAATDMNHSSYTDRQYEKFKSATTLLEGAGFENLIKHASATGGTLMGSKYHFDAVRVGIGLYGLWPSKELEAQLGDKVVLRPVLSWRAVVSEVKQLKAGDYVGYDLTERVSRAITMAVLPIGYWHGFPRALSRTGEVLIRGARARVLGRVSMDMAVVACAAGTKAGDVATIIGRDGVNVIHAEEPSAKCGTNYYEFLTRLNPLMERVVV
jgi:alanine racemase